VPEREGPPPSGAPQSRLLEQPRVEILISGFGGQGVVRMGQILGLAAIRQGLRVTMLKSHGTETRGGYVRAQVVISPHFVDSPVVERADFFVAFSQSAYRKFAALAAGCILYDPDMVTSIDAGSATRHLPIPATALAKEHFNNALFANSIMLGALTALAGFDADAVRAALLEVLPRFHEQNLKGLALGRDVAAGAPLPT
jgi:2-oxoglutarate ferredoxin oxidoreductase subunit gamma